MRFEFARPTPYSLGNLLHRAKLANLLRDKVAVTERERESGGHAKIIFSINLVNAREISSFSKSRFSRNLLSHVNSPSAREFCRERNKTQVQESASRCNDIEFVQTASVLISIFLSSIFHVSPIFFSPSFLSVVLSLSLSGALFFSFVLRSLFSSR